MTAPDGPPSGSNDPNDPRDPNVVVGLGENSDPTTRPIVLVTGAGGAAAVTLIRALSPHADIVAADIDPVAVGLYLVPESRRLMLPRGDNATFLSSLLQAAVRHHVDLVIPTVDSELRAVSAAREAFARHGIKLLVETTATLDVCLDKLALVERCNGVVSVPMTRLVSRHTTYDDLQELGSPILVKPRRGAGGRGVSIIHTEADYAAVVRDDTMLAQEYLPGAEYSIDVLMHPNGSAVAAVPRRRDRVDSGIAIASRTIADPELSVFGREVARLIGATGVVNVQCKRNSAGVASLLEVNARFPGTMPLTIAAGVDMPVLSVRAALGLPIPEHLEFNEVAIVRHWEDVIVSIDEYSSVVPVTAAASIAAPVGA